MSLEARLTEEGGSAGIHLVEPLRLERQFAILAEVYGRKGEGEFGMVGGGLILRSKLQKDTIFEVNGFIEGLRDESGFSYPQIGVGLALTRSWVTLRANGYLPLEDKVIETERHHWTEVEKSLTGRVTEIDWSQTERFERAPMRGFDAEVEFHSPKRLGWVDPSVAIGYYYRQTDERPELYSGILLRGELQFGEHWALSAEYRDDAGPIDQEWRISIRYQHSFGPTKDRSGHVVSTQMLGPAHRSPWPTVAKGYVTGAPHEDGRSHTESTPAGDCCNSGDEPLIFE